MMFINFSFAGSNRLSVKVLTCVFFRKKVSLSDRKTKDICK
nr:MAG TPA: hypothetical protein [Caudoviricetes sp.]